MLRYLFDHLNMDANALDFDGRTPLDCIPRRGPSDKEEDFALCRTLLNDAMIVSLS